MPSLPLTPQEERKILDQLGLQSADDLFVSIPPSIRETSAFSLEPGGSFDGKNGLTEHELRDYFGKLALKNACAPEYTHFLGGGVYDNIIPAIVQQLALRGEFLTCYTPYQPEVSQGTLQMIFEFQTMISRITGLPVSNASMYDGPTALAEAALMAQRVRGKAGIWMASNLGPDYQAVCDTFLKFNSQVPDRISYHAESGTLDLEALAAKVKFAKELPAAIIVGYPNYFGILEPLEEIRALVPKEVLLIVATADLSVYSVFEPAGRLGADIVCGEGHALGTPMLFGGPHVGFFSTRRDFIRQMPGRLCGETVDSQGRRAYTLTLSTREQHIRRDKATSNICTNQGLVALRTSIYLTFLGKRGFERLGTLHYSLFEYLKEKLAEKKIKAVFPKAVHYREGVFEVPSLQERFSHCVSQKVIPGIRLESKMGAQFKNQLLITVNPKHSKDQIDHLVELLSHGS